MASRSRRVQVKNMTAYRMEQQAEDKARNTQERHPKTRRRTHEDSLSETINTLEQQVSNLEFSLKLANQEIERLSAQVHRKNTHCDNLQDLIKEKISEADSTILSLESTQSTLSKTQDCLRKAEKRISRLEREKIKKNTLQKDELYKAEAEVVTTSLEISVLTKSAEMKIKRLEEQFQKAQDVAIEQQSTAKRLRRRIKQLDSQRRRAQQSLVLLIVLYETYFFFVDVQWWCRFWEEQLREKEVYGENNREKGLKFRQRLYIMLYYWIEL